MRQTYFGEIKNGRLVRLPFLGYSILLSVFLLLFGLAVVFAMGVGEHLIGGDLQQAQDLLRQRFGALAVIVTVTFMAFWIFASLNLTAKRIRDVGLPGWWTILALVILLGVVSVTISEEASSGLQTIFWLALLFIPGDLVQRQTS